MPKSAKERKRSVEVMLGKSSPTQRTNVYVALLTSNPTIDNNTSVEPSGTGYARATVPAANWTVATDGSTKNNASVTIAQLPPGSYRYWGIYTAATGGDLIAFDRIPYVLETTTTADFTVDPNNITILDA